MPAFTGTSGAPVPTPRSSAMPPPKIVTVAAHTRSAPTKPTLTTTSTGAVVGQVAGKTPYLVSKAPPPPFPGYLTPAQQTAQITSDVSASLLPQQQAIKDAQAQDAATAAQQQQAVQGYYSALAQILQNAAPQVSAGYQQAAGNDAAFSKGFTDGLAHVQTQAGQQNQQVENVAGSTPGQATDIANAIGGQGVLDALYNATGYQPATNLAQQGAAAGAAASALPAVAGGLGGQAIQQLGNQEQANQSAFGQQLAALAAQTPSLTQQYGNQIASQQSTLANNQTSLNEFNQQEADRQATLANETTTANKPKTFGSSTTGYYTIDPTTGKVAQITPPVVKPTNPKTFGSAKTGYYTITPDGKVTQLTKPVVTPAKPGSGLKAYGGLTPSELRTATSAATTLVNKAGTSSPQKIHYGAGGVNTPEPGTGKTPENYRNVLQQTIALGPNAPAWIKKATQIVQSNPAYSTMGTNGRPYEGAQARAKASQAAQTFLKEGASLQDALAAAQQSTLVDPKLVESAVRFTYNSQGKKTKDALGSIFAPVTGTKTGPGIRTPSPTRKTSVLTPTFPLK